MTGIILIFNAGLFFALLHLTTKKNQNQKKNGKKKTPGVIIILHMCTKNYDNMMDGFWQWWATDGRTDARTDRRKKRHTEVGHPKKLTKNYTISGSGLKGPIKRVNLRFQVRRRITGNERNYSKFIMNPTQFLSNKIYLKN